jgi:peptidoglycan/xylan/chitin deacetylase (PgdA/CDA1 family)
MLMLLVPALAGARTATIMSACVGVTALVAIRPVPGRPAVAAFAALSFVVLLGTIWAAAGGVSGVGAASLGDRRVALWSEAFDLMTENPLTGVGPGRFSEVSEVASTDVDASWAHHEFLQQGGETGIIGLMLLIVAFSWGFRRLWLSSGSTDQVLLAAATLGSVAVMASTDHVLHVPLIPWSVAALVGGATLQARKSPNRRPSSFVRRAIKVAALPWGLLARRRPGDTVILLYHRVGIGEREIDVSLEQFEDHMAMLAEGKEARTLGECLAGSGGVVVTFDDGLADFHEKALPVLVRYRIPAVLYLATGLVESGPDALSWLQLKEAVQTGFVAIGGHTHRHADLSRATEEEAEREVVRCKAVIEDRLAVPCQHFAYPWAVGSPQAERAIRRHFDTASLHAWRINRRDRTDRYRLGRTPILRNDGPFFFDAKLRGMLDAEALAYRALGRGPWARA